MLDQDKSKEELIEEVAEIRRQVAVLQGIDAERKHAMEALRLSEQHHRVLTETMLQGVVHHDADGTIIAMNPAAERILGKTSEQFLGSSSTGQEHDTIREDGSLFPGVEHPAMVALQTSQPVTGVVMGVFNPKVGDFRWISIDAVPLFRSGDNRPYQVYAVFEDITERKQAEEELQKAHDELELRVEQRTTALTGANEELAIFRKFAEDAEEGFGMSDLDGRIVYANPMLCRLLGEKKAEDVLGKEVSAYYPQEYVQRRRDEVLPALLREGHLHIEQTVLPRHGKPIQTLQSTFLIRGESGSPFRIAVVISDITERKRAEEALRQSHDELQAMYDGMFDGLLIVDLETKRFVRANAAIRQILGYSEADLLSMSVLDIHPADEIPIVLKNIQARAEGRLQGHVDTRLLRKDGVVSYADVVSSRIIYRGRPSLVAFFRDVTERKQAEEALRQSEERFRVAFEEAPLGVVMVVGEGILARVNRTFCRMSGYTEEELIGKSLHDITHPEDREAAHALGVQVLAGTIPGLTLEKRYLKKGGGFFWGQITVTAVRDRHGNLIFISGIIENITDRKRAEETLAKEHRNLKHLLHSSDHERQLIAYEIHDGLAQQLAGAIMQLQTYDHQKEKNPNLAAKAYDAGLTMLQQGHFEARRLIASVRHPILDESGVVEAIAHLVHEVGRDKGPKIENRSRVDFDRLDPTLENAVYRITQEALTNACQYSKSEKIRVNLLQQEDRLRIEIRDWGVGFDPKTVPKNHFGLEGIRQRARLLGGKCSIRSKAGKGARVTVELPVVLRDTEE